MIQCPGSILSREIAITKKKLPSNSCLETMAIGIDYIASGSIMPTKRYMSMEREHIPCAGMRWVTVFSRPPLRTSWNNASGSPARSSYPFTDLLSFHCFYAFFCELVLFLPTTRSHKHNWANWQCQLETAICQNTNTFCKYWKSINIYVSNIWKVSIFMFQIYEK